MTGFTETSSRGVLLHGLAAGEVEDGGEALDAEAGAEIAVLVGVHLRSQQAPSKVLPQRHKIDQCCWRVPRSPGCNSGSHVELRHAAGQTALSTYC